jgi:DNA-binding MarR family transcriptional regulator
MDRPNFFIQKHNAIEEEDTVISLPVARDHGVYAGILYPYLLRLQCEQSSYGDVCNKRMGLKWIPKLSMAEIAYDLPIFPDAQTVRRAAETLEAAGLILTESTGKFLEPSHVTNRKRDIKTWWHADPFSMAKKVPAAYWDNEQHYTISSDEAEAHGIAQALILAYWRRLPVALEDEGALYKKLSAVELEKALPMDKRTARRHLKSMVQNGVITPHPDKPKLYVLEKQRAIDTAHLDLPLSHHFVLSGLGN